MTGGTTTLPEDEELLELVAAAALELEPVLDTAAAEALAEDTKLIPLDAEEAPLVPLDELALVALVAMALDEAADNDDAVPDPPDEAAAPDDDDATAELVAMEEDVPPAAQVMAFPAAS